MNVIRLYRKFRVALLPILCCGMFCGTETQNERALVVYMPDGKSPAPGTVIAFMPYGSTDLQKADTVIADADGIFDVPPGLPPAIIPSCLPTRATNSMPRGRIPSTLTV